MTAMTGGHLRPDAIPPPAARPGAAAGPGRPARRPRPRRKGPTLRGDEAGVSAVLGAILLFGLFVVTLVTVQVKFVPVWERNAEADHMRVLQAQLAQLKSDLDRQVDNRTSVPITDPLTLERDRGFELFPSAHLPNPLEFLAPAGGSGFAVATPELRLLMRGGQAVFAGSETWQTVLNQGSVDNVGTVAHMRLRVANPETCHNTEGIITLSLTDANGAYAGKFVLRNIDHGANGCTYEYQAYAASSQATPITIVQENFDWHKNAPPYIYIDLLRSEFLWADVMRQAAAPFLITFTTSAITADYTITYRAVVPGGGSTLVGSGGVLVPNFVQSVPGGALRLPADNQRFPAQTYVLEHGALILDQPDGQVMVIPPQTSARLVAGQLELRLAVPGLQGESGAVGGTQQASVLLDPADERADLEGTAARLSITVATAYPAVWARHWSDVMERAGLSSGGAEPQFTTTTTATGATLDLFGLQASPGSGVEDIHLTLKTAAIHVQVAASGG